MSVEQNSKSVPTYAEDAFVSNLNWFRPKIDLLSPLVSIQCDNLNDGGHSTISRTCYLYDVLIKNCKGKALISKGAKKADLRISSFLFRTYETAHPFASMLGILMSAWNESGLGLSVVSPDKLGGKGIWQFITSTQVTMTSALLGMKTGCRSADSYIRTCSTVWLNMLSEPAFYDGSGKHEWSALTLDAYLKECKVNKKAFTAWHRLKMKIQVFMGCTYHLTMLDYCYAKPISTELKKDLSRCLCEPLNGFGVSTPDTIFNRARWEAQYKREGVKNFPNYKGKTPDFLHAHITDDMVFSISNGASSESVVVPIKTIIEKANSMAIKIDGKNALQVKYKMGDYEYVDPVMFKFFLHAPIDLVGISSCISSTDPEEIVQFPSWLRLAFKSLGEEKYDWNVFVGNQTDKSKDLVSNSLWFVRMM